MPPQDRFERIEGRGEALPAEVKAALSRIARFEALEIGAASARVPPPAAAAAQPAEPAQAAPPASEGKSPCVHCGQLNDKQRATCWACFRYTSVKAPAPPGLGPQDITIVLDGETYTSSDADLPDDIKALMDRIRKSGYSQQLLADWRSWRATRKVQQPADKPFDPSLPMAASDEQNGIKVFRGQRVSVIRLDGKVYTSDDKDLTPELRQLFVYIDNHGVTPALMDYLRQMGQVKLRPPTTAFPSDGDLAFWKDVNQSAPGQAAPVAAEDLSRELERRQAERELEQARWRYDESSRRMAGSAVAVAFLVLYFVLGIWLR